jgi:hypothetical protein
MSTTERDTRTDAELADDCDDAATKLGEADTGNNALTGRLMLRAEKMLYRAARRLRERAQPS